MGQNSRQRSDYEDTDSSLDGKGDLKRSSFYMQEQDSISRVLQVLKRCMFNANYQMIHSFKLPPLILYGILAIEFLQLNYFSLFHLQIHKDGEGSHTPLTESQLNDSVRPAYINTVNLESQYNIMRLLNYQILIIENKWHSGMITFEITLYLHLAFYLILILLVLLLGRAVIMRQEKFLKGAHQARGQKRQNSVEKTKQQSQLSKSSAQSTEALAISILVFIGSKILLIPTFYLISTTFDCSKISSIGASQDSSHIECYSLHHLIMLSVAVVLGFFIALFLLVESLLFQDLNMKKGLPWRQSANRLPPILLLQKIVCILFNFELLTQKPIAIGIFFFMSFVVMFKRYQHPRIYDSTYRRITYFTECGTFWFATWNLLSRAQFDISIYSFTILTIIGLLPFYMMIVIVFEEISKERVLLKNWRTLKEIGSDLNAEAYFAYLIELIKKAEYSQLAKIQLYGIIRSHSYSCQTGKAEDCLCKTLISRIDILCSVIDEDEAARSEQMNIQKLQQQIEKISEEIKEQEENEQRRSQGFPNNGRQLASYITELQSIDGFDANISDSMHDRQQSNEDMFDSTVIDHSQTVPQALPIEMRFKAQLQRKILIETIKEVQNSLLTNQKLKKQIKTLLYKFVYQLIEQANTEYGFSFRLKYMQAFVQYHLLKNEIKGLFEILILEKRNKIPLEWQFFLYKVKAEIEDQMDFIHKERSQTSGRIDVKKVYLFSKNLQEFEHKIENISNKCVDFWKELLKTTDFDANALHRVGTYLTQKNLDIIELVNKMFEINPHHGYLLRIYALFLQQVMNNDDESEKYFTKFLNAQKTFQHYECATLQEELLKNFSSNIKYVIIVMRVTTAEIGIVEDANHEVKTLLGYKRQEIINKNIQMLMPPSVAKLHNQFVQNYLDTAKPKILNKQREVFALKKNGYIQQVFIYVTSVPMVEREGIKFVGFLKKVDEKKYTELLQQPTEFQFSKTLSIIAAPNGNIYGMNDQCFKILGLPKYFVDESDDKISDYNMNFLIKDFKQVLFNALRYSPGLTYAVLSTEGFQSYIVPEMHSKTDLSHIRSCLGTFNVAIQALPIDFGYQGGAYLPNIFFRISIVDQVMKEKPKLRTVIQSQLKSLKSFRSTMIVNKLKQFSSRYSIREEMKEEDHKQEANEEDFYKLVENALHRKESNFYSEKRQSISYYESESQKNSDGSHQAETPGQLDMIKEVDLNDSDLREQEFMKMMSKINKKTQEHQVMNDFLHSSCSASSGSMSKEVKSQDENRLREFRKMVNSRTEPYIIVQLRRLVVLIKIFTQFILLLNIGFKIKFYKEFLNQNDQLNSLNDITMNLFLIKSSFRTFINIQNNIQEDYINEDLFLGQFQSELTENLNKTIVELNTNKNAFFKDQVLEAILEARLETFSTKSINSFGEASNSQSSLNLFLSQIISNSLMLIDNVQERQSFKNRTFIEYINSVNPKVQYKYGKFGNVIDDTTKNLYFIEENIYPRFVDVTKEMWQELNKHTYDYILHARIIFLGLLCSVFIIIFFSIVGIMKLLTEIKKTRIQSLSLYSQLHVKDVRLIVKQITQFLRLIQEQSETLSHIFQQEGNQNAKQENEEEEEDDDIFDELNNEDEIQALQKRDSVAFSKSLTKDVINSNDIVLSANLKDENENRQDLSYREGDLSVRELNPKDGENIEELVSSREIKARLRKKSTKEEVKIGHAESFKQVKSNSGFSVVVIVLILYAFIVAYVSANFILFIPMFGQLLRGQGQKELILTQFNEINRLYAQTMKDLVAATVEMEEKSIYSKYKALQDQQFEKAQLVENILIKEHVTYLDNSANLYLQFGSAHFCDTLKQHLNADTWNVTYCQNVDHQIAGSQGLYITLNRIMGEIDKLRLEFDKKPVNYTERLNLIKKGQWMAKYQLMLIRLFTPAYEMSRNTISSSLQHLIATYQKIDISMLAVFIVTQLLIMIIALPNFIRKMNEQIAKSRGILTLIPSKLIVSNENIKQIIKENKILTM